MCPQCGEEYDESVAFCPRDGTGLVTGNSRQTELVGTVIGGRYRVVSRVGEGGMGQVYLAEHIRMKRKSAIKIMRPALVGDAEALQRFTREAENASKISHPNVASIFDFGETDDGLVYLAMEFVDGESLAATLKRESALHPVVAADIIAQSADALHAAHELGILHRDLKPDNLMLTKRPDGTFVVKLVDFGIARTMDSGTQQVTRTGFAVGTPEFMSPEQLSGDVLDGRSDQYSLALVAFIALTGHDAFANSSSKESLIARLTSRPRRLEEVRSDLEWPVTLQDVIDRSLAPDPVDRYPSVAEFGSDLANAVSEMTPTQTAEIYRHALGQRMASVASRTPGDMGSVRAEPMDQRSPRTKAVADNKRQRRDPTRMRRRPALLPYLVMAVVLTYGTWWYGSRKERGPAREMADRIETGWLSARQWVANLTGGTQTAAPVSTDSSSQPVKRPAPARKPKLSSTPVRTNSVRAPDSASIAAKAPPVSDSVRGTSDSAIPPMTPR